MIVHCQANLFTIVDTDFLFTKLIALDKLRSNKSSVCANVVICCSELLF